MNRVIKFRVWSSGRMEVPDYISSEGEPQWWDVDSQTATCYPSDAVLMQFTGLLDKNGKEIWEGDILEAATENTNERQIVYWNNLGAFALTDKDGLPLGAWLGPSRPWEVIGNIYENPELLRDSGV